MANDLNGPITLPPPIFVMGCQRSGTTLVSRILDSHSRISIFPGTHYYRLFSADRYRYGDLSKSPNLLRLIRDFQDAIRARQVVPPDTDQILEALVAPTFEGLLTTFLHVSARRQGKERGGEKSAEHYLYLRDILENFPDSPVIFTMRDPRDTVLSIHKGLGTSIEGSIWAWNKAFTSYQQASRPVHLIRYEDLVRDSAKTVEAMCSFLGENYEESMLRFFERTPQHFRSMPQHAKLFQPVDARSIGKFRELRLGEIQSIEAGCAAGMDAMGYSYTAVRSKFVELTSPKKQGLPSFLFDRLSYYRWDMKRWRLALTRWKIVIRVRTRYFVMMGPLRKRRLPFKLYLSNFGLAQLMDSMLSWDLIC